jgi:lysylphosphatidylglycerol synthetase-like protein (DUF2156 family)
MNDITIPKPLPHEMKPNVVQAYKDACDNLIYLKKEQFQITYYTWLVLAALYLLSRSFVPGTTVLFYGTFVVGILSIVTLIYFHLAIGRFSKRLDHIYADYFTDEERTRLCLETTIGHWFVMIILVLTAAVATLFTAWAISLAPLRHWAGDHFVALGLIVR